jgi:uncharacterized membrane protein YkvA (DUF1232 family)
MDLVSQIIADGARRVTLEDLDALMVVLPKLKDDLETGAAADEEGLLDQFRFLRHVAEDVYAGLRKEVSLVAVAEVIFALNYLARDNDLIPDVLEQEGLVDDKAVLTAVLKRNESALRELAISRGHDWEMLVSVI